MDHELWDKLLLSLLSLIGSVYFLKWAIPALVERLVKDIFHNRMETMDKALSKINANDEQIQALNLFRTAISADMKELCAKIDDMPRFTDALERIDSNLEKYNEGNELLRRELTALREAVGELRGRWDGIERRMTQRHT